MATSSTIRDALYPYGFANFVLDLVDNETKARFQKLVLACVESWSVRDAVTLRKVRASTLPLVHANLTLKCSTHERKVFYESILQRGLVLHVLDPHREQRSFDTLLTLVWERERLHNNLVGHFIKKLTVLLSSSASQAKEDMLIETEAVEWMYKADIGDGLAMQTRQKWIEWDSSTPLVIEILQVCSVHGRVDECGQYVDDEVSKRFRIWVREKVREVYRTSTNANSIDPASHHPSEDAAGFSPLLNEYLFGSPTQEILVPDTVTFSEDVCDGALRPTYAFGEGSGVRTSFLTPQEQVQRLEVVTAAGVDFGKAESKADEKARMQLSCLELEQKILKKQQRTQNKQQNNQKLKQRVKEEESKVAEAKLNKKLKAIDLGLGRW